MNAERFLNAVVEIEELLKVSAGLDPDDPSELKTLIDRSKALSMDHKKKLHKWRSLRNVIVHNIRTNSIPIADPRDSVVREIERLVDIIKNPPKLIEVLALQPPLVLRWDSEISDFFAELRPPREFSQAPFLDENGQHKLITSNAVARWAASNYQVSNGVLIDRSQISDVAKFSEEGDRLVCERQDITAQRAIDLLSSPQGIPPAAILLTDTGHETGRAMGLAVRADLPALYQSTRV